MLILFTQFSKVKNLLKDCIKYPEPNIFIPSYFLNSLLNSINSLNSLNLICANLISPLALESIFKFFIIGPGPDSIPFISKPFAFINPL